MADANVTNGEEEEEEDGEDGDNRSTTSSVGGRSQKGKRKSPGGGARPKGTSKPLIQLLNLCGRSGSVFLF